MTPRITRVGPHPVQLRLLDVKAVQDLTPRLRRVTLTGDALDGFRSEGADDHVKLFFPAPGERTPHLPTFGPTGPTFPEGVTPPARRDYTPRQYRPDVHELDIDFVLHGDGPGATWAANAQPGDRLGVGGPRGSTLVTYDFDWYLLAGDEAALPAIARRLEELPAGAHATVLLEVHDATDELPLTTSADARVRWLHRAPAAPGTTTLLLDALRDLHLPDGDGFVWVGTETTQATAIRHHLTDERGLPSDWVRAVGYWTLARSEPQGPTRATPTAR
ncbi:siderophore-interacting protein [Deinococcus maricopensis]|uniref:Siderophore-interacting protein n=1 Tax=Deinococcus maricopensis (strain DSM 21211 / LMG 22137 / NRRL B-23946 / LB-34) TaxID=709986 RepID=E8U4C7_DEIML|nr:siderophore-interacting protein [Deinococcus maricopensis]ADV65964.1 Siderophore-interacting protein [Deinococcus maricopensis DSM 21211]